MTQRSLGIALTSNRGRDILRSDYHVDDHPQPFACAPGAVSLQTVRARGAPDYERRISVSERVTKMIHAEDFAQFLQTSYAGARTGAPCSPKLAADLVSRCRRVEKIIGKELRESSVRSEASFNALISGVKAARERFASPRRPYAYVDHITAVRRYREFVLKKSGSTM